MGKIIVVTDDEDRENEGDLIMAGQYASPETVGFIVRYSSGVICCSVCRRAAAASPSAAADAQLAARAAGEGVAAR